MASSKPCMITREIVGKTNRVNEEKLLNEMFIILEYSDSFEEFIKNLSSECYDRLITTISKVEREE